MKKRRIGWLLAACLGISLTAGCGGQEQETYRQAEKDLEQGNYETALQGFGTSAENGYKLPESYRGAGISALHLGNYEDAVSYLTSALDSEGAGRSLKQDILSYRATAELKSGLLDDAMADCQTLASDYSMTADNYYLTGCVALAMDSYDEAASNFEQAYAEDGGYDMAIQIYEAYLNRDMGADGSRYLEAVLQTEAKDAEDYCSRGQVYYYMQDYENAKTELNKAVEQGSSEAKLILGMVSLAQGDTAGARTMYQEYIDGEDSIRAKGYNGLALCDIADGTYDSALTNIASGIAEADTEDMRDLLFNEIVVYEKQLDFATALTKTQEYVEMFPDDKDAAKELTFLQSRVGNAS